MQDYKPVWRVTCWWWSFAKCLLYDVQWRISMTPRRMPRTNLMWA